MRGRVAVAASVLMLAAAHFVGERATAAQNAARDPNDLVYLPEGRILKLVSLGQHRLAADLVWLHAIQYYGEQRLTTRNYDQAERLFRVIYELDSGFVGATRFGALVLSQDAGNPEGALALLERAEQDNPRAWEYPFDQGFIHHTVRRDYQAAGEAYRRAAAIPDAPPLASRLAGASFAKLGDRRSSREIWTAILEEADNDLTRHLAERSLANLDLEDAEELLTDAVVAFREREGRIPVSFEELSGSGLLEAVPRDPWGGSFFWDEGTGRVWGTTTVDRRMAASRDAFRAWVDAWRTREGEYPPTLEALVEAGVARFPPWRPFGLSLDYDAASGRVAWNPPWPPTEPRTRGEGRES